MKNRCIFFTLICLCISLFNGCSHIDRKIDNVPIDDANGQTNYAVADISVPSETTEDDVIIDSVHNDGVDNDETTQTLDARQIESLEAMIAGDEQRLCIYSEMVEDMSDTLTVGEVFTITVRSAETVTCLSDLVDVSVDGLSDVFDKSLLDAQGNLSDGWSFVKISGNVIFNHSMRYNVFQWNLIAASMDDEQRIMERPEMAYTNLTNGDGQYRHYFEFTADEAYDFTALYVVSDEVYEQRHLFFNPGHLTFPELGDGPNASHVVRIN